MTPASDFADAPYADARPSDLRAAWIIARRAAGEALRDRMTLILNLVFAIGLPAFLVSTVVRVQASAGSGPALGGALAIYLLTIGLLPATGAVGVAAGQFAGEKEQGNLAPLLASPASNVAIFGGKILGAILPTFIFAALAETVYVGGLALVTGPATVRLLPLPLSLAMLALVPGVAFFGATVASLVSSRVRTYNAAQQIGGLALLPFWGIVFGLTVRVRDWGAPALLALVLGLFALDAALVVLAAKTWRREEVLAQR